MSDACLGDARCLRVSNFLWPPTENAEQTEWNVMPSDCQKGNMKKACFYVIIMMMAWSEIFVDKQKNELHDETKRM